MKFLKSNSKNKKYYNKINYIKLLIVFLVSLIAFFLFFYYIGQSKNLDNAVTVSIAIAAILSIGSVISDLSENRDRIFVINKKELGYIEIHKDRAGRFLKYKEYYDALEQYDNEEIYKENHLYEGIDKGIIKNVVSIKRKTNRMVVKANVESKEWKAAGKIMISKLYIVEKEYVKKFIIPNDYDEYEELYKKLNKMM